MATVSVPTAQAVVNALAGGQELNAPKTTLNGGDFWVGQDGNVYVKAGGVQGANGAPVDQVGKSNPALLTDLGSYGAQQIQDPSAPPPAPTGGVTSGGGGTTSGGGKLSQSVIDAVMQSIANNITQAQNDYEAALKTNGANQANGDAQYGTASTNNTEGRAQSVQQAEQAGAQGLQGLDAVLASLGALNGTGSILAGRAVANTTNGDIGSANQTFQTNKQAIDQEKGAYDTDYNQKNNDLLTALNNDKKNFQSTGYQQLLDSASAVGDTSLFNKFLPLAVGATAPNAPLSASVIPITTSPMATYGAGSPLTVKANNPSTTPIAPAAGLTPANSALSITKDNS